MKKQSTVWLLIGAAIILGLLWWTGSSNRLPQSTGDLVASNGIHWHPVLTIYVDDVRQEIPASVGLVGGHQPIHTHAEDAADGVLHFEFSGAVRKGDLRLDNFFRIWGNKDIETAFGTLRRMTVNGEENTEYGAYAVGERDTIELFYTAGASAESEPASGE